MRAPGYGRALGAGWLCCDLVGLTSPWFLLLWLFPFRSLTTRDLLWKFWAFHREFARALLRGAGLVGS